LKKLKGGKVKVKTILIFTVAIAGIFSFVFADGFLYPSADILQPGQISFSLGNLHISAGAGIGSNLEIGGALSYYEMGVYLKAHPFKNTAFGLSYLPFQFCLFGIPCETTHLFNIYGVYKLGNEDLNANIGAKLAMANDEKMVDGFAVVQKKIGPAFLIAESGVSKVLSVENVNFEFGLGVYEKFGFFTFKGGLLWYPANFTAEKPIMHPFPYLELGLNLDLIKSKR
jgi:hypothetical protein